MTRKEKIVNLFLFITGGIEGIIREIGAVWHDGYGSDAQKIKFLQSRVNVDWKNCKRHKLPDRCVTVWLDRQVRWSSSDDQG